MHSAIVVINMPETLETKAHHPAWLAFLEATSSAAEPMVAALAEQDGVVQLAENVWQVNFQENPGALARLLSSAMHHKLSYGILQLEHAPVWHPAAFQPRPHTTRAVENRDPGARLGQQQRRCAADAAAASRHHGALAGQQESCEYAVDHLPPPEPRCRLAQARGGVNPVKTLRGRAVDRYRIDWISTREANS